MARGGTRRPANPAPVSGPGALSQRTDGGPANPITELPSQGYGQGVALDAQIAGAPIGPPPGPPAAGPPVFQGMNLDDVFAPSTHPGGPVGLPPDLLPDDEYMALRVIYSIDPNPDIAELLEMVERERAARWDG